MKQKNLLSPLIIPLLGAIAGIYTQANISLSPAILCIPLFIGFWLILYGSVLRLCTFLIGGSALIFFAVGAVFLTLQHHEAYLLESILNNQKINILGVVCNKETWGATNSGDALYIDVNEIFIPQKKFHQKISCKFVYYQMYHSAHAVGDTLFIENIRYKRDDQSNIKQLDFKRYLTKEGIIAAIFATKQQSISRISRPLWSFNRWLWQTRSRIYEAINNKSTSLSSAYVGLIFMGNKQQQLIQDLKGSFGNWGVSHYLARSGLHIVLFIVIWSFLLRWIPLHMSIKKILLIILCVLYDITSWSSIPFVRAYYAFLYVSVGQILCKVVLYQHILALICLGIILHNPLQIFFLDFQLTFGLTFALIFIAEIWKNTKNKIEPITSRI